MAEENTKEVVNKITLPASGEEVIFKDFLEAWIIMDLKKQENPTKFLLENIIVSIGGKTEGIYEKVRKGNFKDYKCIDNYVTALIEEGEKGAEDEKK